MHDQFVFSSSDSLTTFMKNRPNAFAQLLSFATVETQFDQTCIKERIKVIDREEGRLTDGQTVGNIDSDRHTNRMLDREGEAERWRPEASSEIRRKRPPLLCGTIRFCVKGPSFFSVRLLNTRFLLGCHRRRRRLRLYEICGL